MQLGPAVACGHQEKDSRLWPEFLESAGVMVGHAIAEAEMLQQEGKTAIMVAANKEVVGVIGLLDTPSRRQQRLLLR